MKYFDTKKCEECEECSQRLGDHCQWYDVYVDNDNKQWKICNFQVED